MAEESLQNAGEKEDAAADELFLVKFHFHSMTANEADAVFGNDAGEMTAALHAEDSSDLPLVVTGLAESVEPQYFLE
jgi:hypothetical protein